VKFIVETTAKNSGRRDAAVAALNDWVQSR
jgi:hypothetical protein